MTGLILSWHPVGDGSYTYSRWTARRYPTNWRLFENKSFVFSAVTPREIEIYVLGRMESEHRAHRQRFEDSKKKVGT